MLRIILTSALFAFSAFKSAAQDDYKPGPDSIAQPKVPQGELIKGTYTAKTDSVFPGTEREYTIYLPPSTSSGPDGAPFMIFQDGIIYNAPVVFDNLIAKKQIPPLIGLFIKPGVVPAANENALPRDNRSYEYDSVTDTYSRFLIDEFLPAIEKKHVLKLSTDPNDAAIAGNSSGAICAFMAAWHRPDRIRRVFSAIGTYVGIRGGDHLPVLVRKYEPKPLRIFLQDGENDNDIYCGDWWMANQMMERALTWAGYDVNHAWGTGGHNQKHATAIFPEVLRWLWRDYATAKEIKTNPRGESKWRGYEVVGYGEWVLVKDSCIYVSKIVANTSGTVVWLEENKSHDAALLMRLTAEETPTPFGKQFSPYQLQDIAFGKDDCLFVLCSMKASKDTVFKIDADGIRHDISFTSKDTLAVAFDSVLSIAASGGIVREWPKSHHLPGLFEYSGNITLSPDQTTVYQATAGGQKIIAWQYRDDASLNHRQEYCELQLDYDGSINAHGLCVDTNGWLYVATALGIQVCDQAGRVNFIIPTPQQPHDVCFGGKDLSELFIACGDKIYKRPTKARGYISGQMAPIKPVPRKFK